MSFGGNGHWVRTHNKQGAEAFLAEQKMERDRYQAKRQRELEFFAAVRWRIRRLFSRS